MKSNAIFGRQNSDLDAFLFAEVGIEPNGMRLTVISVIGRRDEDPWKEARRLASLPKASATDYLARIIAQIPHSPWGPAEAAAISSRLVPLLPLESQGGSLSPTLPVPQFKPGERGTTILLSVLFLAYLVFGQLVQNSPATDHTKTATSTSHQSQSSGALETLTPADMVRAAAPKEGVTGRIGR